MGSILVYILRRDLRFQDNPIFHNIIHKRPCTLLLPIYVFAANQIEVSGFLSDPSEPCPYPEARSAVGGFWRCGPHRARFLSETVFDLDQSLRTVGSGLIVRVGSIKDVLASIVKEYEKYDTADKITSIWMTTEEGVEEMREEEETKWLAGCHNIEFKSWTDEKYFIDDRDIPLESESDLPDVFTSYRKKVEPLKSAPRRALSVNGQLPPLPTFIPDQEKPFQAPFNLEDTTNRLLEPLIRKPDIIDFPSLPAGARSAHPFQGGEKAAHLRIKHLISSGSATSYKDTRNGFIGLDFSTKLSAWLALGSCTARQVHEYLHDFEEGRTDLGKGATGYGNGENSGTGWIRFELLWRDYMRLCARKFKQHLFKLEGMKGSSSNAWKTTGDKNTAEIIDRFLRGNTGTSLIDASNLTVDWRIGAEWYESLLVYVRDYDVCSNWGNWQSVSITDRKFNPIKQSYDYDPQGTYIRMWVEELRPVNSSEEVFQPWKLSLSDREAYNLDNRDTVTNPLRRIDYVPKKSNGHSKRRH